MKRVAIFAAAVTAIVASGVARASVVFSDDFTEGSYSYTASTSGGNQGGASQALSNNASRSIKLVDPTLAIDGLDSVTAQGLARFQPTRIAYVSCDPATLGRDLKFLFNHGYELETITAVDMFPQTHHVESVAHLKRSAE